MYGNLGGFVIYNVSQLEGMHSQTLHPFSEIGICVSLEVEIFWIQFYSVLNFYLCS